MTEPRDRLVRFRDDYEKNKFDTELGAVRTIPSTTAIRYSVKSSNSKISYVGFALVGTLGSTASWQIQEIDSTSGVIVKIADGDENYDNILEEDSLEFATSEFDSASLVQIDATHYIVAYQGPQSDGYIKTFSIDGNYDITEINELEHDTSYGLWNSLVQIDSTHYFLVYRGAGTIDGYAKTFSINDSFEISEEDSLMFDGDMSGYCSAVKIDNTHFIVAYAGKDNYGHLQTFSIDRSYVISVVNNIKHDAGQGTYNSLISFADNLFMLAYRGGANGYGYLKTFSVDGSYDISSAIDTLDFNSASTTDISLIQLDNNHYIVAYELGYVKTFSID